jgi:hypothetical protein
MAEANRNVNHIAAWAHDQAIAPGANFWSTSDLFKRYQEDTSDSKISLVDFARKLTKVMPEAKTKMKSVNGFNVSKTFEYMT